MKKKEVERVISQTPLESFNCSDLFRVDSIEVQDLGYDDSEPHFGVLVRLSDRSDNRPFANYIPFSFFSHILTPQELIERINRNSLELFNRLPKAQKSTS